MTSSAIVEECTNLLSKPTRKAGNPGNRKGPGPPSRLHENRPLDFRFPRAKVIWFQKILEIQFISLFGGINASTCLHPNPNLNRNPNPNAHEVRLN